ncbi:MAG: alpha/beta hydrolase [Bacteroidia bacterium]
MFVAINIVACFHAYKFTHFSNSATIKTKDGNKLPLTQKLGAILFGINNPRPVNATVPQQNFKTIKLKSNKEIECWLINSNTSIGTVILFHGYSGQKSSMLDKADVFLRLGYDVLLVDFMGSGGSEGNQTTIGFYEAQEVKTAFDYISQQGEKNIILFGTSMGAVAIMKAQNDYALNATALIIECPFGTMLQTVQARFKSMHIPIFPMANLLVFWGGLQNNFNAFKHNPTEYAKNIKCPTLLLYGQQDDKVSKIEIDSIYKNLRGNKLLKTYPLAGHENYLTKYEKEWIKDVSDFIWSASKQKTGK